MDEYTADPTYAYTADGFAKFYDLFVDKLQQEGGFSDLFVDIPFYFRKLQTLLSAKDEIVVLDMCTGSGRVLLGLLKLLTAAPPTAAVRFVAVDHSNSMLEAARCKLQHSKLLEQLPTVKVDFVQGRLDRPVPGNYKFDMCIVSAGSLHHLVTATEQQEALQALQQQLASNSSIAVFNVFSDQHLGFGDEQMVGQAFEVGPFQRTCTLNKTCTAADGTTFVHQLFQLRRHKDGKVEWTKSEGWKYARIEHQRVRDMSSAAGLGIVEEYLEFEGAAQDECGPHTTGSRVFVAQSKV